MTWLVPPLPPQGQRLSVTFRQVAPRQILFDQTVQLAQDMGIASPVLSLREHGVCVLPGGDELPAPLNVGKIEDALCKTCSLRFSCTNKEVYSGLQAVCSRRTFLSTRAPVSSHCTTAACVNDAFICTSGGSLSVYPASDALSTTHTGHATACPCALAAACALPGGWLPTPAPQVHLAPAR